MLLASRAMSNLSRAVSFHSQNLSLFITVPRAGSGGGRGISFIHRALAVGGLVRQGAQEETSRFSSGCNVKMFRGRRIFGSTAQDTPGAEGRAKVPGRILESVDLDGMGRRRMQAQARRWLMPRPTLLLGLSQYDCLSSQAPKGEGTSQLAGRANPANKSNRSPPHFGEGQGCAYSGASASGFNGRSGGIRTHDP